MRAVIRPEIQAGDPLDLALIRIAEANGVHGPQSLISSLGLSNDCRSRRSDLSPLQRFIGLEPSALPILETRGRWAGPGMGLINLAGLAIPLSAIGRPLGRICPLCVAEGVAFRATWDIKATIACDVHGCFLRDACPECRQRIGWNRPRVDRCRCGGRLARPSDPAPPEACLLARKLGEAAVGIGPLELGEAGLLAWFVGVRSAPAFRNGATVDRPDVTSCWTTLQPVADILDCWPDRFSEWLIARRAGEARSGSIYEHLPILGELRRVFCASKPVMDATIEALNGDCGFPPLKRQSTFRHPLPIVVGASAMARARGLAPETLIRLVQDGRVPGRIFDGGGRRMLAMRSDLMTGPPLLTRRTNPMIAGELGVARKQVLDLKRAGLVEPDDRGRGTGHRIEALLGPLAVRGALPRDGITLSDVPKLRSPGLVAAIRRVLDGSLMAFTIEDGSRPVLGRFIVSRSELLAAVAAGQMSVKEIARELKVPVRLVPLLIEAGCLEARGQGKRRRIPPGSLRGFRQRFATAGQLAKHAGTNSRTVLARLRDAGLRPVIPSDVDKGISSVWRREEAEEWVWVRSREERGCMDIPVSTVAGSTRFVTSRTDDC